MKQNQGVQDTKLKKIFSKKDLEDMKKSISDISVSESIYEYIKDIIFFTRESQKLRKYLSYGASPRASL
jgi:MoxR-like ATPase